MDNEMRIPASLEADSKVQEYIQTLDDMRSTGIVRINGLKEQINKVRKSKMLSPDAKEKQLDDIRKEVELAKADAARNKESIDRLASEAVSYVNAISRRIEARVNAEESVHINTYRLEMKKRLQEIKEEERAKLSKVSGQNKIDMKLESDAIRYEASSAAFDAKSHYSMLIDRSKAAMNQALVDHVQINRALRNGKTKLSEDMRLKWSNYKSQFKISKFLLSNGLYLAIIIFFMVCVILAPLSGKGNLFSLPNIFTILEQSSTRMFYALGVAGLILLAGTDLSVGRMVALGAVSTGLILHPGKNIVRFFSMGPWDFSTLPMIVRVLMALVISIVLCVAFSSFAGFFTARFKIHPFISTLSTQLIIYGLLFFGTTGTPVGSIDSGIKDMIGGRWIIGISNGQLITFPKLIIPAVIAVIVAWFIWNKTIFGKNMYAVGGNAEAAAVSGISVFKVTLGVFIMAGVFYGCGAFLEAFRANASAGTGQGYELDAIAACVVGGISFNGGIGKIRGAVIGVIIFTGLTYCLTFLGIDTNLQFVFKGIIIIAAVALDSVKYIKKK